MSYEIAGIAAFAAFVLVVLFLDSTDTPKIKNLPEIPGVPIFGNLLQLGQEHARVAGAWAKKYGPVFQVRLGTKVCDMWAVTNHTSNLLVSENCVCQYI